MVLEVWDELKKDNEKFSKVNEETLLQIIRNNENTEYGEKYHFSEIQSLEDFRRLVPTSDYEDYRPFIDRMMDGEVHTVTHGIPRYYTQSSGTTGKKKNLPVTEEWMDVYWKYGCVGTCQIAESYYGEYLHGKIFFTNEIRRRNIEKGQISYLASVVSLARRREDGKFRYDLYSSPEEILFPEEDMDIWYLKLLFALAEPDIEAIHGTFGHHLLRLFTDLKENWESLVYDIEHGTISRKIKLSPSLRKRLCTKLTPDPERAAFLRAEFLKGFKDPILIRIWPGLKYVMAISGNAFLEYQKSLKKFVGDIPFHCYVYGSSEGLIGIPRGMGYEADYIFLPRGGFYEFSPIDEDENIIVDTADELQEGKRYRLIYTSVAGLYRYRMGDIIEVTGHEGSAPVVRFCYREQLQINVAGEKMNMHSVSNAVHNYLWHYHSELAEYCVYPDMDSIPGRHILLLEADPVAVKKNEYLYDRLLRDENMDYDDCRNLGEIGMPKIYFLKQGTFEGYKEYLMSQGLDVGQVKPVKLISTPEQKEYFFGEVVD